MKLFAVIMEGLANEGVAEPDVIFASREEAEDFIAKSDRMFKNDYFIEEYELGVVRKS
jgi:hypothetical protein